MLYSTYSTNLGIIWFFRDRLRCNDDDGSVYSHGVLRRFSSSLKLVVRVSATLVLCIAIVGSSLGFPVAYRAFSTAQHHLQQHYLHDHKQTTMFIGATLRHIVGKLEKKIWYGQASSAVFAPKSGTSNSPARHLRCTYC